MSKSNKPKSRKLRSESTHRLILEAARKTLKQRGFQSTTIREIAREARVATGTVMAHCGSKEDLLYEVLHDDIRQLSVDALDSIDESAAIAEILQTLGGSFLDGYASDAGLYADFLEYSLFARGEWGERFTAQVHEVGLRVAGFFREAIERKELGVNVEIPAATMTFFANYYFVLIGQIKSKFADVEAAKAQLGMLIQHQVLGLKK